MKADPTFAPGTRSDMAHKIRRGTRGGRHRPIANAKVLRVMQRLEERLEAMETGQEREPQARDVSTKEEESPGEEAYL